MAFTPCLWFIPRLVWEILTKMILYTVISFPGVLCTLSNNKVHWLMLPGKVIPKQYRWSINETAMEDMFPGSLKPSRQCSCCLTNTEIYIVCQVHAPDLDVGPASPPHVWFQHACLLHSRFLVFIFSTTGKKQPQSEWALPGLIYKWNILKLSYHEAITI